MKVKIIYLILILIIAVIFLSGCIDTLHYVGKDGKKVNVSFRVTLQKMIFELFGEMSGEEVDDDYFRENFGIEKDDFKSELPEGIDVKLEEINTELDYGFEAKLTVTEDVIKKLLKENIDIPFVPIRKGKGLRILIPCPDYDSAEAEEDEAVAAFLASAKYRLVISKSFIPKIENIFIKSKNETLTPTLMDFHEVYMVEFPMVLWFLSDDYVEVIIY